VGIADLTGQSGGKNARLSCTSATETVSVLAFNGLIGGRGVNDIWRNSCHENMKVAGTLHINTLISMPTFGWAVVVA
jgi:hypothetical protein